MCTFNGRWGHCWWFKAQTGYLTKTEQHRSSVPVSFFLSRRCCEVVIKTRAFWRSQWLRLNWTAPGFLLWRLLSVNSIFCCLHIWWTGRKNSELIISVFLGYFLSVFMAAKPCIFILVPKYGSDLLCFALYPRFADKSHLSENALRCRTQLMHSPSEPLSLRNAQALRTATSTLLCLILETAWI